MGKPGPKAHSVINDLLKNAKGKSPLKAMYGKPFKRNKGGVKMPNEQIGKQNTTEDQRMGPGYKGSKKNKLR
jgi:hypothetical protein